MNDDLIDITNYSITDDSITNDSICNDSNNCMNGERRWFSWDRQMAGLAKAEEKMLSAVKRRLDKYYVRIFDDAFLWTVTANKDCTERIPLVMVHGYGSGVGMWCLNYDQLSRNRAVYTFDLLGFGRSTRIKFPKQPDKVEEKFVQSIEEWRQHEKIEKLHLLGHSFGGFIVGCYALQYPERVQSLIFADPWGFPDYDVDNDKNTLIRWGKSVKRVLKPYIKNTLSSNTSSKPPFSPHERSKWVDDLLLALGPFSPLSAMRVAGPWGPKFIERFKKEYTEWFSSVNDENQFAIFHYLHGCNSFNPSGERAFSRINKSLRYQSLPMVVRITHLRPGIPITFLYGSKSWIPSDFGYKTKELLPNNDVAVYIIKDAGHHLYAQKADEFNKILNDRLESYDEK